MPPPATVATLRASQVLAPGMQFSSTTGLPVLHERAAGEACTVREIAAGDHEVGPDQRLHELWPDRERAERRDGRQGERPGTRERQRAADLGLVAARVQLGEAGQERG